MNLHLIRLHYPISDLLVTSYIKRSPAPRPNKISNHRFQPNPANTPCTWSLTPLLRRRSMMSSNLPSAN